MICIPAPKWALQFAKTKNFGSISFTTVIIKDGRLAIGHMSFWEQALKYTIPIFKLLRSSFITIFFLLWILSDSASYSNMKVSFFFAKDFFKSTWIYSRKSPKRVGVDSQRSERQRKRRTNMATIYHSVLKIGKKLDAM